MSSTMTWVIYWWRRCLLIAAQLLQQPVCLQYLALAVDSLSLTHSSLAAALRRRATSGLGKTPAGAQLSILVVIFLFFHYGFVSSGCNRRAINQHYFHISARRWRPSSPVGRRRTPAVLPPSCWAAPVEARRGSRRGNVIDRAVMFVDRVGPRRLDAPAGMQFPSTRSRRRPVKECWTCVCVCGRGPPKSTADRRLQIIFIFDVSVSSLETRDRWLTAMTDGLRSWYTAVGETPDVADRRMMELSQTLIHSTIQVVRQQLTSARETDVDRKQ